MEMRRESEASKRFGDTDKRSRELLSLADLLVLTSNLLSHFTSTGFEIDDGRFEPASQHGRPLKLFSLTRRFVFNVSYPRRTLFCWMVIDLKFGGHGN